MTTTCLSAKLALFEANISKNKGHVSQDKSFLVNSAVSKSKLSARKVSDPKPATKRAAWKNIAEATAKMAAVSFAEDLTGTLLDEDAVEKESNDCLMGDVSFSFLGGEENVNEAPVENRAAKVEADKGQEPEDEDTEEHESPVEREDRGMMVDWELQQKAIVRLRANRGLSTLKISDRSKTFLQESFNTLETCSVCSESFHGGN
jgi:hypothetical protein